MKLAIYESKEQMAEVAARKASEVVRSALAKKGHATFVAATGTAQHQFLSVLTRDDSIDWSKTTMFHLDEYVGISDQHPASFRRYLRERLLNLVHPGEVFLIEGDAANPDVEARRLSRIIERYSIDVAFVGVGENSHIAFNDPPADFGTSTPFLVVSLDEVCRRQQVGEAWFNSIDEVPKRAITMSVGQIMKSQTIVCVVPDSRKAVAVKNCFGDARISPMYPASILKKHPSAFVFLDRDSSSLIRPEFKGSSIEFEISAFDAR